MVSVSVKMGTKGQIVIPKVFRDAFGMDPGSEILIADEEKQLVIQPKKIDLVAVFEEISKKVRHKSKINMNAMYDEQMKGKYGIR